MNRMLLTAALTLAVGGLSACEGQEGRMVNGKICANFKTATNAQTAAVASDAASPVNECLRRWAYSLAGARDRADVVADAAVAACAGAMTRWNQAGLSQQAQDDAQGPVEALSLTTGEPTNPLAAHSAFARGRALFYVVEARAGRCAPPPAANGIPVGVASN
ncbi:MAG TPA: hypothetical protein VII73_08740 [Caulobacteraceae bacterium]